MKSDEIMEHVFKSWLANVSTVPCHSVCTEHALCPRSTKFQWTHRVWKSSETPGSGSVRCLCLSTWGAPVAWGARASRGTRTCFSCRKKARVFYQKHHQPSKPIVSLLTPITSLEQPVLKTPQKTGTEAQPTAPFLLGTPLLISERKAESVGRMCGCQAVK